MSAFVDSRPSEPPTEPPLPLDPELDAQHPLCALAQDGDAAAQEWLAAHYHDRGDFASAARWYRKAAEQGSAGAQYNLGWLYYRGRGVPRDDAQTLSLWLSAAEAGLARAMSGLGFLYKQGRGVPQDHALALAWYARAAEHGDAAAQAQRR